ncbi:acyl-coenzyme A synthetase ACSM3, mitochondrial-like [Mauremys mutica]|uniref:acyl-coenzyme A synthetase ACSM3, mitochondrial-like n=1 Tax=Mauremys mutica TaxID=74926 RepID=UPI001D13A442|nr:acyl-coenzyme A synthetase ACSM3, mitochondrial-like [Mauremys mutica]
MAKDQDPPSRWEYMDKLLQNNLFNELIRGSPFGLSQDFSTIFGAPTLFRMLVQHDLTSSKFMNLQHCVSGGEPLNPEVMEQWKRTTGLTICEVYGQTETGIVCSVFKGMKIKPGSMGKAVPLYDVQIIDENANVLPPGQEGEIAIRIKPKRPLGLFSKYIDNPEKTASSERGNYFVTGDRGTMDEEGYFWFLGRSDDVINSSGYRIGPSEVENALIEHPAVVESASSILLIGASSRVPS